MHRRQFLQVTTTTLGGVALGRSLDAAERTKPSPPRTALIFDNEFKKHVTPAGHPERPARLDAVGKALRDAKLFDQVLRLTPRECRDDEIVWCHKKEYLDTVKRDVGAGARQVRTGDTPLCKDSLRVARLAAGATLVAVDAVLRGKVKSAFCAVRPPGHHATPNRGMGFCLLNNVALAARYAQKRHGLGKVLIVDWDVHHGNGTQDIFYSDPSVFFFSTHQSPWYPGTGAATEIGVGRGKGTTLNRPFPAGAGRKQVLGAFRKDLANAMKTFRPELVLVSAGFDSRRGDPLGRFTLSDRDFVDLTETMKEIAESYAGGRLVSVLEGGYNLSGLGSAAAAHVRKLMG